MDLIRVKKLNTTIERVINHQMADLEITSTQTDILRHLYLHPEATICQKDLESALALSRPTVSSVLKRLAEKQLIQAIQQENDHRFKQISLTPKSIPIMEQVFLRVDQVCSVATKGFSEADIEQFFRYLDWMNQNLKESNLS